MATQGMDSGVTPFVSESRPLISDGLCDLAHMT